MKQKNKKRIFQYWHFILLYLFLINMNVYSQSNQVRGVVVDNNGKPLKGVIVQTKNSLISVFTDNNGEFTLSGADNVELTFFHPDYYNSEARYKFGEKLIVQLAERFFALEQAVLPSRDSLIVAQSQQLTTILHGQQNSRNLIQSISTVNTNQLTTTPSSQFTDALMGRMAGLNMGESNGAPGTDNTGLWYNVRGRGQTVLIDGVERSYTSIDPEQIESVSILKDALSTVMYGQRSSNGIVLVTTKKGEKGTPRISFTAQSSLSSPLKQPKVLSSADYATLYNEAQRNDWGSASGFIPKYSDADIQAYKDGTDPYGHPNVDWYNTVLKKNSSSSRYNFNVQGSAPAVRYFVDVDYMVENGLFKESADNQYNTNAQVERYIARSNVGVDITKNLSMQVNLMGRIQKTNESGNGTGNVFSSLLTTPNNASPVYNSDGSFSGNTNYQTNNLARSIASGYVMGDVRDMTVDVDLKHKLNFITKGLWIGAKGSYNNTGNYKTTRSKNIVTYDGSLTGTRYGTPSDQSNTGAVGDRFRTTYVEGNIGFENNFGKNNISALVVANQQSKIFNGQLPEQYTDYAGRLNYNYDEKYLLEVAGGYSGYNWFAPQNRFEPVWAAGIGWNIHKESFIANNFEFISKLKLRGTYGKTAQANTGYYSYIQQYWVWQNQTGGQYAYYWGNSSALERGSAEANTANPSTHCEKARKLNLGVDLGLWNNKLTFTGEVYKNKLYDLMGTRGKNNALFGTSYPSENIQKFDYWGTELSLTYQNNIRNFNYYISGNISTAQSKVIYNDEVVKDYAYQISTGRPVGATFGYTAIGFLTEDDLKVGSTTPVYGPRSSLRPGDLKYEDRNADGKINNDDMGYISNSKPNIYFGVTFGFKYKGWDASFLLQGQANRRMAVTGDFEWAFGGNGLKNAYEHNLNRWTVETAATATLPRVSLNNPNNQLTPSTFWIKDANFIRLKNMEIGYTLPAALTHKWGIPTARFFVNGLNLLTLSDIYKWRDDMDPEQYGGSYPLTRVVNVGCTIKL